jgi:hypothetical protein
VGPVVPALRFELSRPNASPLRHGPFENVAFVGNQLTADGTVVATYSDNRWQVKDLSWYSRIDFTVPVDIRFSSDGGKSSRPLGPYGLFSLVDGVAYAANHVFAVCDEQNLDWYCVDLGSHWKRMIVLPAAR